MSPEPGLPGSWTQAMRERLRAALDYHLPEPSASDAPRLSEAMRYSALGGGKLVRPLLVYGACRLAGGSPEQADVPAAAVEIMHVYSLIHDDLPAMDDDELRRGRLTCHRAFDTATAILAGDTLHTFSFDLLSRAGQHDPAVRIAMIQVLCQAAGNTGMAAGQMQDVQSHGRVPGLAALERMHHMKTGCLITASLQLGYLAANADRPDLRADLTTYGNAIGLAFQIQDDILDVIADSRQTGKPRGSDERHGKTTFPALLGLAASRERARALCHQACDALVGHGDQAVPLLEMARYIVERSR